MTESITPGEFPKSPKSYCRDACTSVFTAAPVTIVGQEKQPRFNSTNGWRLKMSSIVIVGFYSVIKNMMDGTGETLYSVS